MLSRCIRRPEFITMCVILLGSCSSVTTFQNDFTHELPTVFRNADGAIIEISPEGMLAAGHFYKASDCSNKFFNCRVYGDKILLIAPKVCFPLPAASWRVGKFAVSWRGYDLSADVLQNTYGNGISYVFSEVAGKGVRAFAYDVSGDYHIDPGKNFYGHMSSDQANQMLYFSPAGPALLPCKARTGRG